MYELLPLFGGVILAQIAPGPNLLATASVSIGTGRHAGLMTAAGIASGVFLWAVLFSAGLGALLSVAPVTLTILKLGGGLHLCWLGLRALCRAFAPHQWAAPSARHARRPFRTGLAVMLTNPKAAMMWIAVSVYLAGLGISGLAVLPVGAAVAASAMLVYGCYAGVFSTGPVTGVYTRFFRWIEGAFGTLFALIGFRLALDELRAMR